MINVRCGFCYSTFLAYPYSLNRNNGRFFCSRKCSNAFRNRENILSISCSFCGKNITRHKSHVRKKNFCSTECNSKYRIRITSIICQRCGNIFNVRYSSNKRKYCSVKCKVDNQKIKESPYNIIIVGNKHVIEHRWVAEQHIGRDIFPDESVHHINGKKRDNHISNLAVINKREHGRLHGIFNIHGKLIKKLISEGNSFEFISNKFGIRSEFISGWFGDLN